MVDLRFHPSSGPLPLGALLAATIGRALDDRAARLLIAGADELETAGPDELALAAHKSYRDALLTTAAGAVVVEPGLVDYVPPGCVAIPAERPHELFADLLELLFPRDTRSVVTRMVAPHRSPPVREADVRIGANVVIGPDVEIGRGTIIGPNTVIGAGVAIGRNCVIGSNCSIECAYLGDEVVLHAGARVGTEGFGWLDFGRSNRKIPQLGRVIVQDKVEIGANSTVDRGALGDTVVGEGSKIDNLVQIGHNCRIGRYCLIAATSGLAGGTVLGDGVLLGGGVGSAGHLTIGAGSVVYARAGVSKSWPPGSKLFGSPARDVKDYWKEAAALRRLSKGEKR